MRQARRLGFYVTHTGLWKESGAKCRLYLSCTHTALNVESCAIIRSMNGFTMLSSTVAEGLQGRLNLDGVAGSLCLDNSSWKDGDWNQHSCATSWRSAVFCRTFVCGHRNKLCCFQGFRFVGYMISVVYLIVLYACNYDIYEHACIHTSMHACIHTCTDA